ncbi:hypothetical protein [Aeromicrobium sp. 179-A 4D2 NHS]|uniref:hypothetical protein n=1 Tax=Aeromicrobium sp. 179-A 4D2 NHS TaxID=3142375 RepID=UPI0039A25F32
MVVIELVKDVTADNSVTVARKGTRGTLVARLDDSLTDGKARFSARIIGDPSSVFTLANTDFEVYDLIS